MLDDADMARNTQTWEAVMEPFPESAVLGGLFGLCIAALVIGRLVVGFIARDWSCKERGRKQ